MRVLLVEDERATARLLAKGLREQAFAVDVVHDGLLASERLADSDYDIVVLDVMLPRQSGLDVCRRLRASGRHVPVLPLASLGEERLEVRPHEIGDRPRAGLVGMRTITLHE